MGCERLLLHKSLGWKTGSQGEVKMPSWHGKGQARMEAQDLWLVTSGCQDLGSVTSSSLDKETATRRWHLGGEGIRCVGCIQTLATVSAGGEYDDRQGHGTFQML